MIMKIINNYFLSAVYRKLKVHYCKMLKIISLMTWGPDNRIHPVLVNSFPKSGTHLLQQIVKPFPGLANYNFFIASAPSRPHVVRDHETQKKLILKIIPGELVTGHLFYDEQYEQLLADREVIQFFIYRDLRDVIVSERS